MSSEWKRLRVSTRTFSLFTTIERRDSWYRPEVPSPRISSFTNAWFVSVPKAL